MGRVERLAVLLAITAAMYAGIGAVRFHGDESHWIGLSAPFEALFSARFTDPTWQTQQDRYLIGPVTFYVIGAARRLGGWKADALNAPYDFGRTYAENLATGRVPEPDLLWWSRAGVVGASVIGVFACFVLFAAAAGRPAAYLWLGLVLVNPYLRVILRRAMSEGVLLAMLALVLWATRHLLAELDRSPEDWRRWKPAGWMALAGCAAGLATQTKLNGAAAGPGVLAVLVLLSIRHAMPAKRRAGVLLLGAVVVTGAQTLAYLGSNPTLWPYPPREIVRVVRARTDVMRLQMRWRPSRTIDTLSERVRVVSRRVFHDDALVPGTWSGVPLVLAGVLVTLRRLREWLAARSANHAVVVLAVIGAVVSAPAFMTPLDWKRYYFLPAFFAGFPMVLGADWAARWTWRRWSASRTGAQTATR
jgi:hypothetical protein